MLTPETKAKARRQMLSYGEAKTGAMDHLPSKITGPRQVRRYKIPVALDAPQTFVRRWDDERGAYVYVEL